ncbi:peptidase S8/S53 domain-containing protein [Fennellomyces sp. T-0311]|nr:peptidase S8/S53 domain-containing protein [Fennellomyces sp. T-0311]
MRIITVTILTVLAALTISAGQVPGAYMIEYADHGSVQHNRLLSSLEPLSNLFTIRQTYSTNLFRGISIHLHDSATDGIVNNIAIHPVLQQLVGHPDIQNVYPVLEVPRPQWIENQVHLPFENKLSQLKDVHKILNITGSGITVGILDSGVDYYHSALGGGFGEGFKVRLGHNLVDPEKDDKDVGTHRPPNDPFDVCNDGGHGTHVSGIIGGLDKTKNFVGVAPDATLGMWRIFGCTGGADEDIVIKAMEMAYAAGCNVINLSLGVQSAWAENAMSVVADRLTKNGVVVVSVAGNQGTDGAFMQNSPGSGPNVISVASVDNSFYFTRVVRVDRFPGETFPYEFSTTTELLPNGTLAVVFDDQHNVILACPNDTSVIPPSSLNDTILLVRRGQCNYDDKVRYAQQAGAKAVIFYDANSSDDDHTVEAMTPAAFLPSAGITKGLANKLIEATRDYPTEKLQLAFSTYDYNQTISTVGQVSSFSSVGPTYELDLKPTLAGIGYQVYSTLPRHSGDGWGTRSGTSMAAPHIAGVAGLMLEYYRQKNMVVDAIFITEQLQNQAHQAMFKELPDHPLLQGAGLVDPFQSMQSGVHISPGHVSFNDSANLLETQRLHITNSGSDAITLNIQHTPSKAILPFANTSTHALSEPHGRDDTHVQLSFLPPDITLQPGQSADIRVTVTLPSAEPHYQMYGGFIKFAGKDNSVKGSVPYFGLLGRLNELPIFDQGFPYIAPAENHEIMYSTTDTFVLNITMAQHPAIISRILSPIAQVTIQVMDQAQTAVIGDIDGGPFKYWDRNRLKEPNFTRSIEWNGKIVTAGNSEAVMVAQGTYRLRVRALKWFGQPDLPDQWEEWISCPILVQ